MKHAEPRGLSRRRIEKILSRTKTQSSAGARMEVFSRLFLAHPYKSNPLVGSVERPEIFTASLNDFDCVTYIETVLALTQASSAPGFIDTLRRIRYEAGKIEWERRNHYMTGWIRSNTGEGIVRRVFPRGISTIRKDRTLNVVPGLRPKRTQFECVPKSHFREFKPYLKTGDLIFFASTRRHLDVYHCGVIVRSGDRVLLRHASRSRAAVVEQELSEFLKANRMAGVIVVRPAETARGTRARS